MLNTPNYTEAQTLELVHAYKAGATVAELAELTARSTRSVVAKLSREGVYKRASTQKTANTTKAELVKQLEVQLGCDLGTLQALEAADRQTLLLLHQLVYTKLGT